MAKRRSTKEEKVVLSLIYGFMMIVISAIAFFHDRTGFLGKYCGYIGNYLFGEYWLLIFAFCGLVGLYLIFTTSLPKISNIKILGVILLAAALMLLKSLPADKTTEGKQALDLFLKNSKNIFYGKQASNGGLIGIVLYFLISSVIGYFGAIIVFIALVVCALIMIINFDAVVKAIVKFFKSFKKLFASKTSKKTVKKKPVNSEKEVKKANFIEYNAPAKENKIKHDTVSEKEALKNEKKEEKKPVEKKPVTVGTMTANPNYELPRLSLLSIGAKTRSNENKNAATIKGRKLIDSLEIFGLNCTLQDVFIGPSVTKFEVRPEKGINVKKFNTIADNLKMELEVKDLRIEAPVPGKNAVGIEIPNVVRNTVRIREVLQDAGEKYKDNPLVFALGKNLSGQSVLASIDKMPHLLIAGSTGSGKSVCINSIICSILLKAKPDEVNLLLIDPKKVEFNAYNDIPHLCAPVVTDTTQAAGHLNVLCQIMDERYNTFKDNGCRNIQEYNSKAEKTKSLKHMPYIVVVIDELADLMLTHGKEVNSVIQRLTQLARACGIYLILATQRPSTDVITGIIKTNVPSRIAFAVANSIDSRIIIDETGAEDLLGNGDMLFKPMGSNSCERIQGVYVSDEEIEMITEYVKSQQAPRYYDVFIEENNLFSETDDNGATISTDPMYEKVKQYVIETGKASTSSIQRYFGTGYNRSARMMDSLEQEGIIGPQQGSKPREVYYKSMEELYGSDYSKK